MSQRLRLEVVAEFGARKGQVISGIVLERLDYDSLFKAVQGKLKLCKKEASLVTLYCEDFAGRQALTTADLTKTLHNGMKIVVAKGEPEGEGLPLQVNMTKSVRKAVDELNLVRVGRGALSARGRPSPQTLFALKHHRGLTGVVTLLRHDECFYAEVPIGEACERLGLRWCHAPLAGPKEMGMIGEAKVNVTHGDLDSFRKVHQVKGWLESGEENIVVHCAAGLHRTGIFLFVLLRECGETPDQALENIRQMRQMTFNEFGEHNFLPKAEAIFALVGSGSVGSAGSAGDTSVVEVVAERTCEVAPEEDEMVEEEDEDV
jgi:hypothetical protein